MPSDACAKFGYDAYDATNRILFTKDACPDNQRCPYELMFDFDTNKRTNITIVYCTENTNI